MRALLLAAFLLGGALAHVPVVAPETRAIEDPTRSYAFYDTLAPGETHAFTFTLRAGDPLFIHVAVPLGVSWRPDARLEGPQGEIPLEPEDRVGLEPFTPYASREVASMDTEAPSDGAYTLTVAGEGGPYAFGFGLAERFTAAEWATIPVAAMRIHAWEGRPVWLLAAPWLLGLAAALAWRPPRAPARWMARVAAGLFAASALDRAMHLVLAARGGAEAALASWTIAIAFILPSLVLAWAVLRVRRTAGFAGVGVAGILLWSGLLVGPALAFVAGLAPFWERERRHRRGGARPKAPG